jgi:hypothetical protein
VFSFATAGSYLQYSKWTLRSQLSEIDLLVLMKFPFSVGGYVGQSKNLLHGSLR